MLNNLAKLTTVAIVFALTWAIDGAAQPRVETPRKLELTLRPWGFEAPEFRLKPGRWQLTVKNRVGLKQLSMRIEREAGPSMSAAVLKDEIVDRGQKLSWDHELDLTPGTYLLQEITHPRWRCRIIIAP